MKHRMTTKTKNRKWDILSFLFCVDRHKPFLDVVYLRIDIQKMLCLDASKNEKRRSIKLNYTIADPKAQKFINL